MQGADVHYMLGKLCSAQVSERVGNEAARVLLKYFVINIRVDTQKQPFDKNAVKCPQIKARVTS